MQTDTLKILYFRMLWVLGLKGIATMILYWKFTNGDIGVALLVASSVLALILVKLDHATKKTKENSIELEILGLLMILVPLTLLIMDYWCGSLLSLLKMQPVRFCLLDVVLTIIISRVLWIMRK